MKPNQTINHVIPWPEVALLSSSKKQRVNRGCGSRIIHEQSTDSWAIKLEHTINRIVISNFLCLERDDISTASLVTYLVSYDGNVVYSQLMCIHSYLSYSLGCISVQEDSGSWCCPLFVYILHPLTNILNWLLKGESHQLLWVFMLNHSRKNLLYFHWQSKS